MTPAERLRLAIALFREADDAGDPVARLGAYLHMVAVVGEIRAAARSS